MLFPRSTSTCCLIALTAAIFCGCQSGPKGDDVTSPGAINDTCPVSNDPIDPAAPKVSYNGKTIAFCCPGCIAGWNKMSDEQKRAFVRANEN
jgi:hypothetical protein